MQHNTHGAGIIAHGVLDGLDVGLVRALLEHDRGRGEAPRRRHLLRWLRRDRAVVPGDDRLEPRRVAPAPARLGRRALVAAAGRDSLDDLPGTQTEKSRCAAHPARATLGIQN